MKNDEVRIGIIGAGLIGSKHMAAYADIQGARVVACADLSLAALERAAGKYGVPAVYEDFRELLARDDIDAVDVCLHNNLHMPASVAALRTGKHVFCEKPMAGSYRDARDMLDAARTARRELSVQLSTLFAPETRAALSLIPGRAVGDPLSRAGRTGFRPARPALRGRLREPRLRAEAQRGGWRVVRHGRIPHRSAAIPPGESRGGARRRENLPARRHGPRSTGVERLRRRGARPGLRALRRRRLDGHRRVLGHATRRHGGIRRGRIGGRRPPTALRVLPERGRPRPELLGRLGAHSWNGFGMSETRATRTRRRRATGSPRSKGASRSFRPRISP